MKLLPFHLVAFASWSAKLHAYKLDASCNPWGEMVIRALDLAFEMAQAGQVALAMDVNHRGRDVEDLVRNLFTKDGADPKGVILGKVKS